MAPHPAPLAAMLLAFAVGLGCGDPPPLSELGVPDTLSLPRAPFEAIAGAEPDTGRFNVAVAIRSARPYVCPPCPPDADCTPCVDYGEHIIVDPYPPRPSSGLRVCTRPPIADVLDEVGHSGAYVASLQIHARPTDAPEYDVCMFEEPVQLLGLSRLDPSASDTPGGVD